MRKAQKFLEIVANEGPREAVEATYAYTRKQMAKQVGQLLDRTDRKRHRLKYGEAAPDPYRLIYIDPNEVNWMLIPRFHKSRHRKSVVCSGEWDRRYSDAKSHELRFYEDKSTLKSKLVSIENFTFYKSFEEHFSDDVPWEETEIYDIFLNNDKSSRYTSEKTIQERLEKVDELFNYIEKNGYKSQRELINDKNSPLEQNIQATDFPPEHNEVWIHIGRSGELIFCTGQHRFSIARILGVEQIPVKVHMRHKIWQNSRYKIVSNEYSDLEYSEHPDINF